MKFRCQMITWISTKCQNEVLKDFNCFQFNTFKTNKTYTYLFKKSVALRFAHEVYFRALYHYQNKQTFLNSVNI
jgi:hypothetical protein